MNKDVIIGILVTVIVLLVIHEFNYDDNEVEHSLTFDNNGKMAEATFNSTFAALERQKNTSIASIIVSIHKNASNSYIASSYRPTNSPTRPVYSLDGLVNGAHMKKIIQGFPTSWQYPMLISAVADEKYIYSAQMFVESLLEFGFVRADILLLCTNALCSEKLLELNINSYVAKSAACEGNLRCLISDGKTSLILQILKKGYSVFFFDLDIFFKSPILEGLQVSDSIEMYVQNNNDYKYPYDLLNYGMFLLRPTLANINFFNNVSSVFWDTNRCIKSNAQGCGNPWDQWIFNKVVETLKFPYAMLPDQEYYLHTSNKAQSIRAVHMICVEGSQNKMFIGRELYGPFTTPSYYTGKKTITAKLPPIVFNDLVGLISMLLRLARLSRRWIRILGENGPIGSYLNSISIYDADKLFNDDSIQLVEQRYWDNVKHFNPSVNITTDTIRVTNVDTFLSTLTNRSIIESSIDDLVLTIDTPLLKLFYDEKYNSYVCKLYNNNRYQCLQSCQGNHFRKRIRH